MSLYSILSFIAALCCGVLAALVLFRDHRSFVHRVFAAGMIALALEAALTGVSVQAQLAETIIRWQRVRLVIGAFIPPIWLLFALSFTRENYRQSQVHAAIGIAQLRKLDMIIRSLRENRDRIIAGIRKSGKFRIVPSADPKGEAGTSIVLMFNNAKEAEKAGSALAGAGISSGRLYSPRLRDWHTYPYWEHIIGKKTITKEGCPFTCSFYKGKLPRYSADMCPRTSDILGRSVAIWVSPAFGAQDCRQIAEAINTVESCPKGIPSGNVKS